MLVVCNLHLRRPSSFFCFCIFEFCLPKFEMIAILFRYFFICGSNGDKVVSLTLNFSIFWRKKDRIVSLSLSLSRSMGQSGTVVFLNFQMIVLCLLS